MTCWRMVRLAGDWQLFRTVYVLAGACTWYVMGNHTPVLLLEEG